MSQTLKEMQEWMQQALHAPKNVSKGAAVEFLRSHDRFAGVEGLAVYQRSYFLRIVSCMREQFPALCYALGQELFDDFVAEYIEVNPPEHYSLYDLGRRFPEHLEQTRPDRQEAAREVWIDFMVDLARFERAVFEMFDAPGHEGKPFARIETADTALRLQPCFRLVASGFAVAQYYHGVRKEVEVEIPARVPKFVALVRKDYLTQTINLRQAHFEFLQTMVQGATAPEAIDAIATRNKLDPRNVTRDWKARGGVRDTWITAGFFIEASTEA